MAATVQVALFARPGQRVEDLVEKDLTVNLPASPWPKGQQAFLSVSTVLQLRFDDARTHTLRLFWKDPAGRTLDDAAEMQIATRGRLGHWWLRRDVELRIPVYEEGLFRLMIEVDGRVIGFACLASDPDPAFRSGDLRPFLRAVPQPAGRSAVRRGRKGSGSQPRGR
jgi:hypothetical protein